MIEVKGNSLIITVEKEKDKAIFDEIINLYNSKINKDTYGEDFLRLSEAHYQIREDAKFNRGDIYNEDSRFHR